METELTYEKAIARLEEIVAMLENGKCELDQSLQLFEEGTKLTAYCTKLLQQAEQKILTLTASQSEAEEQA